jgi:hypothetical protein
MTSTQYFKQNMIQQTIASLVDSAPQKDLTPSELRELFGEDENGKLLPEQELNVILGPAYADVFAATNRATKPPAKGNGEGMKKMTALHAKGEIPENVSKPVKAEPLKAAKESKKSNAPSKENVHRANDVPKLSHDAKASEALPKSRVKAKARAPSKVLEQRGVWNSVLHLCQQIEVYAGVKVDEYHGFDSIAKIVGEIELEENSLRLKLLKHADGGQELIVSGVLSDRGAATNTKLNDAKDTSLIELSGRVQFQPDVEIEE